MEREALKLALEALERTNPRFAEDVTRQYDAVTAIREALAQPAQKPMANSFEEYCKTLPPLWNTHISRTYAEQFFRAGQSAQPAHSEWNAALDEAAARIGEIKGFGQATQDSFAAFIQGLKK